ncbi:hypothetical protein [Yinghuangia soli]|uniref:Uncharacterized protein n=1 Tax=Yinghuangia soli TaxID=2908204 RepID=A0AA41TWE0_9ACTN|nr:hypothetical protein [Yinghuangia soli]MCF2525748.1 hypothetical protein [Yinghuangia soli]
MHPDLGRPRVRRRWWLAIAAAALVMLPLGLYACSLATQGAANQAEERLPGQKKIDVPLPQAAARIDVTIPANATDATWAYIAGFQDDIVLLSFRMPEAELEAYLTANHIRLPLEPGTQNSGLAGFAQYGVGPDPESVTGGKHTQREPNGYIMIGVSIGPPENGLVRVWIDGYN